MVVGLTDTGDTISQFLVFGEVVASDGEDMETFVQGDFEVDVGLLQVGGGKDTVDEVLGLEVDGEERMEELDGFVVG